MIANLVTRVPRIILGTEQMNGSKCVDYIHRGLEAGYRMIDTAQVYKNEGEIGAAIRSSSIPHNQVHITTKIAAGFKKNPSSFKDAVDLARGSLIRLGLEYVDLVLIHHPGDDTSDPSAGICRQSTWQALESLVQEGRVKNIGVSNYGASHIIEMRKYMTIPPCVNQLELHPWCQQRKLVEFCRKEMISVQAYSSAARNTYSKNAELQAMARKYKVSAVPLLLRYCLQKGYTPIVKATSTEHLYANIGAERLVICDEDMTIFDSWDKGKEGFLFPWLANPIDG